MSVETYYIDLVGSCNLKCPSCPIANSRGADRPVGVMSENMFTDIVRKIRRESPDVQQLWLFNWTEPVLHPRLPALIEIAREEGFRVCLSSNLNAGKDLEGVMAAAPLQWIVSLSGFTQDVYARGHTRGDIETVKANMERLAGYKAKHGVDTHLLVSYHCYNDNLGDEYEQMRAFSESLGFHITPTYAYFYPLEKLFDYFEAGLEGEDQALVDRLIVSPARASDMALAQPSPDCVLRSNMMTINCDGSVALCCAVFDKRYGIGERFVDVPLDELQARKYAHDTCKKCMGLGLHDAFAYHPAAGWRDAATEALPGADFPEGLFGGD